MSRGWYNNRNRMNLQMCLPQLRLTLRRTSVFGVVSPCEPFAPQQTRAWLLFHHVPPRSEREAFLQHTRDFLAGRWDARLEAGAPRTSRTTDVPDAAADEAACARRRALACANVRRGEVSRARGVVTSAAIAPGTDVSDPARPQNSSTFIPTRHCAHPHRHSSADCQTWHRCMLGCRVYV